MLIFIREKKGWPVAFIESSNIEFFHAPKSTGTAQSGAERTFPFFMRKRGRSTLSRGGKARFNLCLSSFIDSSHSLTLSYGCLLMLLWIPLPSTKKKSLAMKNIFHTFSAGRGCGAETKSCWVWLPKGVGKWQVGWKKLQNYHWKRSTFRSSSIWTRLELTSVSCFFVEFID